MATIKNLVEISDLKNRIFKEYIDNKRPATYINYNPDIDTFFIWFVERDCVETSIFFVNDTLGLIVEDENLEIVGLQVESFQKRFIKKYPELQTRWNTAPDRNISTIGDLYISVNESKPKTEKAINKVVREIFNSSSNLRFAAV
jgi:hypothetical protein